jgi:hypothetical protein
VNQSKTTGDAGGLCSGSVDQSDKRPGRYHCSKESYVVNDCWGNPDVEISTPESFKLECKGGSVSCDSAKESIIDPDERLRDDDHDSDAGITNLSKKKEK